MVAVKTGHGFVVLAELAERDMIDKVRGGRKPEGTGDPSSDHKISCRVVKVS